MSIQNSERLNEGVASGVSERAGPFFTNLDLDEADYRFGSSCPEIAAGGKFCTTADRRTVDRSDADEGQAVRVCGSLHGKARQVEQGARVGVERGGGVGGGVGGAG